VGKELAAPVDPLRDENAGPRVPVVGFAVKETVREDERFLIHGFERKLKRDGTRLFIRNVVALQPRHDSEGHMVGETG